MDNLIISNASFSGIVQKKNILEEEHLVVPVVALREGVFNSMLYNSSEIEAFVDSWNGVPVPVQHPEVNGISVSANNPIFEEKQNIGKFFNAKYGNKKLTGEIWINTKKAEQLGFADIVTNFLDGKMMEVSTGLFANTEIKSGVYNGKPYKGIIKNIRPDHLALLPGKTGACSISDGCGAMRTNEKGEYCCGECKDKASEEKINAMRLLGNQYGFASDDEVSNYQESYEEVRTELYKLIQNTRIPYKESIFIAEIYPDYFIYEHQKRLYRLEYEKSDGRFTLTSGIMEVNRRIAYEPVTGILGNKEENIMEKEVVKNDKEEIKVNEKKEEKEKIKVNEISDADMKLFQELKANAKAAELLKTNQLSDDDMALFKRLKANEISKVEELKTNILANFKHLTADLVNNMSYEAIEALAMGIQKPTNFVANSGAGTETQQVFKHPEVIQVNRRRKKKGE